MGRSSGSFVKRKHSKLVLQELGGNKKMKESGFIIPQGIPSHSWMQWGLDATLNRYGIRPGRQWDGVNHSLMDARTKCSKELMRKQAKEREAYLRMRIKMVRMDLTSITT